jgi:hypothetical protein
VLATLAFAAAPAFASMIIVNNPSFEILPGTFPTANGGGSCIDNIDGLIPDWTSTVQRGGQLKPGVATGGYINQDAGSLTSAWANDGMYYQPVGATVGIGTVYTLRVDIGQKTSALLTNQFGGYADLLIGGTRYAALGTAPTPGGWSTFTATYTGLAVDVGKSITIELQNIPDNGVVFQANFDNVRLDDAVPEPASFLLIGSALLALKAFRRRRPIA